MKEEIITIENLKHKVLNNLNISFYKNTFTTISGSNKCGKTLLLRIISRKILTEESIKINNKDINEYTCIELNKLIGLISKKDIFFNQETALNELKSVVTNTNEIIDKYNLQDIKNKQIKDLSTKESIYLYLIINILRKKEILLIDNIDNYYSKKEMNNIMNILHKYKGTIIMTITNLDYSIDTDYLYILKNGKIVIEGTPNYVLQNDNIVNKVGLNLPFMYDLTVKLKDYNLLDDIVLDPDRMVNILWK